MAHIGDRVVIISECNSCGLNGTVIKTFYAGYSCQLPYVMVELDNGKKQGYNQLSVKVIEEKENNKMTGFKNVAIVNLLDDYNKKDYGFALYESELEEILKTTPEKDALVVVNARGKNNRVLGIVKSIVKIEEYSKNVTAQVVGVVNMNGYEARLEDEKNKEEIRKHKAALIKDVEERIRKQKDIEFYEKMAVELGEKDPELKDLVAELRTLEE